MTKKTQAVIAFALALVLLSLRAVGPTLATFQVRLLPVNASIHTSTEPAEAVRFDQQAWEQGTPVVDDPRCLNPDTSDLSCYVHRSTATASKTITSAPAEKRKEVRYSVTEQLTLESGEVLFDSQDEVRLVRHSSFPVDELASSLTATSPIPGFSREFTNKTREGLQYSFPFATEFRSYQFFDKYSGTSTPIDFHDAEQLRGAKVYRFHQKLSPIQLGIGTIKGPARQFYSEEELASTGLSGPSTVVLNQYYTMTRTLWVEPKTGTIVDSVEIPRIFLARDDAEAASDTDSSRTLFSATLRWDESTKQQMWNRAREGLRTLKWVEIGLLLTTVGSAVSVFLGVIFLRRALIGHDG